MSTFDKHNDNIAIVIKDFTLKRKSEIFFDRYSEPYIVSMAIDANGGENPAIDFNILPYPKVRKGETVSFDGQGHLIYGPKNPGDFVAYSILFLESDKDIREAGNTVEEIIKSEVVNMGAKAILKANPSYGTAISILRSLTEFIAVQMQKNKDDELFRRNGTLLRDVTPAYDILRTYTSENDYIKTRISVIPLENSNELGTQGHQIPM